MVKLTKEQILQIKGVFYGQAIGDALGLGTEFLTRKDVEILYPNGLSQYNQIVQDSHRNRWPIGSWTDDTDQFLALCDSILKSTEFNTLNFAEHLFKWFNGVPMGIGSTTQRVLSVPGFINAPTKAAELIWKMSAKKNASNGAIMRTSIIGTFHFWDVNKVIYNAELCAKVTHADPKAIGSCVIICYIIAKLIQDQNEIIDKKELINIANQYSTDIATFIDQAYIGGLEDLNLDHSQTMGYTLKTMACALWAYYNADDFELALLKIVNQGGDADTNAAVACAVLGAKLGFDKIPKTYTQNLLNNKILEDKFIQYIDTFYSYDNT